MKYEKLELCDTTTGGDWWNEARTICNKAIKAYNKCIKGKISVKECNEKCKKSYKKLDSYCCNYSEDFNIITEFLNSKNKNTDWYNHFED